MNSSEILACARTKDAIAKPIGRDEKLHSNPCENTFFPVCTSISDSEENESMFSDSPFPGISRRSFLKYCAALAALIGAGRSGIPDVCMALDQLASRPAVVLVIIPGMYGLLRQSPSEPKTGSRPTDSSTDFPRFPACAEPATWGITILSFGVPITSG